MVRATRLATIHLRDQTSTAFVAAIPSEIVRGLLALVATGLLWGLVLIGPGLVPDASATSIVGGRFAVLGVVSAVAGRRHLQGIPWGRAFRYACAGFVGYYLLFVLGIQRAGAAPVAAVLGVTPVLYAIAGAKRERLDARRLAGPMAVLLCGIGLVHVVGFQDVGRAGAGQLVTGLLLALASVVVWIWYGLENAEFLRTSGINGTRWTSAVGVAAGVQALPLLGHGLFVGGIGSQPSRWLAVVVVLGMGSAWLGTVAWNAASRLLPEALLGPLLVIELLIGLTYAHALASSLPTPLTAVGYLLLVVGVVLSVVKVERMRGALAADALAADAVPA